MLKKNLLVLLNIFLLNSFSVNALDLKIDLPPDEGKQPLAYSQEAELTNSLPNLQVKAEKKKKVISGNVSKLKKSSSKKTKPAKNVTKKSKI